ncbi:unnamed protein product [Discosporangium mesarthrocarpum]
MPGRGGGGGGHGRGGGFRGGGHGGFRGGPGGFGRGRGFGWGPGPGWGGPRRGFFWGPPVFWGPPPMWGPRWGATPFFWWPILFLVIPYLILVSVGITLIQDFGCSTQSNGRTEQSLCDGYEAMYAIGLLIVLSLCFCAIFAHERDTDYQTGAGTHAEAMPILGEDPHPVTYAEAQTLPVTTDTTYGEVWPAAYAQVTSTIFSYGWAAELTTGLGLGLGFVTPCL